jgi:cytochrome P450
MSGMIFAAMDTTSSAIARTLYILATNPAAQDRLRAELVEAFGDREEMSHDEVNELPWLDAVCRETMRVYTPVTIVPRV